MTIYFDARFIRIDHHDGISRFSAGLFSALQKKTELIAIVSDPRQLEKIPPCKSVLLNDPTKASELFIALRLNRLGAQQVFSPMQTMGSLGRKYRLVLTLHDLIYYRHPAPPPSFSPLIRAVWRLYHLVYWPQRLLLNRADAVATVSETTKKLMLEHRLTKRPISVVYNAAEQIDGEFLPKQRPKGQQTLVYMGSFMDYKNVETLISGMADLPGYELLLLSRVAPQRKDELESGISKTGGSVQFLNGVSDEEYAKLIESSVALVHASQDEGFGIPLVESMARGVPVVVSDIDIFKEIGGDAATYFDQNSGADFAMKVKQLEDDFAWATKSKASLEQAKKFSWNNSADALLKIFSSK